VSMSVGHSSAIDRVRNYTEKLIPSQVGEDLTTMKPAMVGVMTVIFGEVTEIEDRVKAILATKTGVTVKQSIWYQNLARKAYSIRRKWYGGNMLDVLFAALVDLYKARGLTEANELQILNEIFAWTPPAP
jgi:hypothetical protein